MLFDESDYNIFRSIRCYAKKEILVSRELKHNIPVIYKNEVFVFVLQITTFQEEKKLCKVGSFNSVETIDYGWY